MRLEVEIERLGTQGDGIARRDGRVLYVPCTLPGERVRVECDDAGDRAALLSVADPSRLRSEPICGHFGTCGGCALQHLEQGACRDWKREQVAAAFVSEKFDARIDQTVHIPAGSRRRAVFALGRKGREVVFGYSRRHSHELVDIVECPVLRPAIERAIAPLRALLGPLVREGSGCRATVIETDGGLDVAVSGAAAPRRPGPRQRLMQEAGVTGLARLTLDGEVFAQFAPPRLRLASDIWVVPPPGAFIQASREAEEAMLGLVQPHFGRARKIADLFCGIGTFTLALARHASVTGFDSDAAALAALDAAVRGATGLKPIRVERRNLMREPLSARELSGFDAVLFDPPRAGAMAQAEILSRTKVRRIAAVSCNPPSLARDVAILVSGGYRLDRVIPIDQFVFSARVEAVALLSRP